MRGLTFQTKGQPQFLANASQNQFEVRANLVIGEADDAHAESLDHLGPGVVIIDEPIVLLAVEFDDELGRVTVEVCDVAIERNPPLEFRALEARAAQPLPKDGLGARRLFALAAGELNAL